MTIDSALEFDTLEDTEITVSADMGDLDFAKSDIGTGEPLWLVVVVTVTGTTTAEAQFVLKTHAATASLGAASPIMSSPVIEFVDLKVGEVAYAAPLPAGGAVLGRVRLSVIVTNGAGADLEVKAWIGSPPQSGLGIRTPIAASA